jgi:MGT family glycosyltransferase
MGRFLFTNWEGGGHVNPMLMVARDIRNQGHTVLFISDACNAPDAAAFGVEFEPWRCAPSRANKDPSSATLRDFAVTPGPNAIDALCGSVICGPAADYARDIAAVLERFRPDIIVTHDFLFGAMIAGEASGIPTVIFTSTVWLFPTVDAAPLARSIAVNEGRSSPEDNIRANREARVHYDKWIPRLNEARQSMGLRPIDSFFGQLNSVKEVLLGTSREFDLPDAAPANARYVGPYVCDPPGLPDPGNLVEFCDADDRPLIVFSVSTLYQRPEQTITSVLEAVSTMPAKCVVTLTRGVSMDALAAPPNVLLTYSASHEFLLPRARVMISQAGHGTIIRTLSAGVPLLCLPKGRDQFALSSRAVGRGAALVLREDASPASINDALTRLLSEASFRENAKVFGQRIQKDVAMHSAVDALESLLAEVAASSARRAEVSGSPAG